MEIQHPHIGGIVFTEVMNLLFERAVHASDSFRFWLYDRNYKYRKPITDRVSELLAQGYNAEETFAIVIRERPR